MIKVGHSPTGSFYSDCLACGERGAHPVEYDPDAHLAGHQDRRR